MEKRTKVMLSQRQSFELGDLLRKYCTLIEGEAVYADGWSDQKVLEEFQRIATPEIDRNTGQNKVYTISNVAGLRQSIVGPLRQVKASTDELSDLRRRVSELEATVAGLVDIAHAHDDIGVPTKTNARPRSIPPAAQMTVVKS